MNYRNLFVRRARWLWLAAAVLMAGLLLSAFLTNVSAANYNVIYDETYGTYQTEDGTQVLAFGALSDGGDAENWMWEVQSLTVGENQDTYQDTALNWYYPTGADSFTVTLKAVSTTREGLLLAPISVDENTTVNSCTVEPGGTILVIETTSADASITSIQAKDVPDENGVVKNDTYYTDRYYYQTASGLFAQMPQLRIEEPMVEDFLPGQLYDQSTEGSSVFYGWFVPGELELTLTDDYIFVTDATPTAEGSPTNSASVSFRDERTLVVDSSDWTDVIQVKITGLSTAALNGTVTEVTGTEDWLYPLGPEFEDWTVIVDGGSIYQDTLGQQYVPNTSCNLTLKREGYWLPTDGTSLYSARFEGGTTLIYTNVTATESVDGVAVLPFAPPTVEAVSAPSGYDNAAQGTDGKWYYSDAGTVFSPMTKLILTVSDAPSDLSVSPEYEDFYGWSYTDGTFTGYFMPIYYNYLILGGGYAVGEITVTPEGYEDAVSADYDVRELTISYLEGDVPAELAVTITVKRAITITFPASPEYTVWTGGLDTETAKIVWVQGTTLPFELRLNDGYYDYGETDPTMEVHSCTVSTQDQPLTPDEIGYTAESWEGTIPGDVLTADCSITFDVTLTGAVPLISLEPVSGAGYRVINIYGATPGSATDSIVAVLMVEPDYNNSTPSLEVPGGYAAELLDAVDRNWNYPDGVYSFVHPYQDELDAGSIAYIYEVTPEVDGAFPDEGSLAVTVTGVVPNYSGGGGGGGGSKEEIRVENQLNQEGASSDTKLWPNGTKEQNGVSTTTVTDKELEALINLAQQHIEDIKELEGDGYKEGIIVIEDLRQSSNIHTYILKLTESQFQRIAEEEWDRFTVQTPAGSLSLYGDTILEVAGLKGAVDFTISRLEYEGRPGVDVTLTVDGKSVTAFSEVYGIRAFVPYAPAEEEDVNALLMDYIHEDGTAERVTESFYDETAGGVYVFTDHLSKFGVAYRPVVYTDVGADHWASPYVTFLAARGLLDSGSTFRPDDKATRGELLELLAEALSAANLPSRAVQVYSDVATSSSVAKAASWAYYNNLTGSIASGGKLRPNEAITREDMAALVGNVASGVGLRLRSKGLDTGYTDLGDVASYARSAVTRLRAAGILEMADNYKFSPDATLNRGEMAQIVATLLSNL